LPYPEGGDFFEIEALKSHHFGSVVYKQQVFTPVCVEREGGNYTSSWIPGDKKHWEAFQKPR
jgi:hypothetical protein